MSRAFVSTTVTAVLGPTNTGKTHLAMERLVEHADGVIGFPLRLLARENYDRLVANLGAPAVALVTGEEKIVPASARYFVCTVESMPLDRQFAFVAVDEVQLAADPERGHIFTDRLLHARGTAETMLLGADTMRGLVRELVPGVHLEARPRFSELRYAGEKKLTRLRPRSAVVAFSVAEVYSIAETLRRTRGGTAVVLGALSPRTRNAQVAMFQAGEVDTLVVTDAIGMGLNMDVTHVAFASLRKFDGRDSRELTTAEMAQIAGRAGRYMTDGTFGSVAGLGPLDPGVVDDIEHHRFPPLTAICWRNSDLDMRSLPSLVASLREPPPHPTLVRGREVDDIVALEALAERAEVRRAAGTPDDVELLWELCQVPDFRKISREEHHALLLSLHQQLFTRGGRLDEEWLAQRVRHLETTEGDVDELVARIAHVRTWSYVSQRDHWLQDPAHWQERTRALEDRLSDALHERLTQRFVDRLAVAVHRGDVRGALAADVADAGDVTVAGERIGKLEGLRFVVHDDGNRADQRLRTSAAGRALASTVKERVALVMDAPDADFTLAGLDVSWAGERIGRLHRGHTILAPTVRTLPSTLVEPKERERLDARLTAWLRARVDKGLAPLVRLRDANIEGAARGVAYQLVQSLGALPRRQVAELTATLGQRDRQALRELGVRLGFHAVFVSALLKPQAISLRASLWCAWNDAPALTPPPAGAVSFAVDGRPEPFVEATGYRVIGTRAYRLDMLDRAAIEAQKLARTQSPFAAGSLLSILGCSHDDVRSVLAALGYEAVDDLAGETRFKVARRRR